MSEEHLYHHYERVPRQVVIRLERGQRGGYGWEITGSGDSVAEAMEQLREADTELRREYAEQP